jgi:hypothetical protein
MQVLDLMTLTNLNLFGPSHLKAWPLTRLTPKDNQTAKKSLSLKLTWSQSSKKYITKPNNPSFAIRKKSLSTNFSSVCNPKNLILELFLKINAMKATLNPISTQLHQI